MGDERSVAGVAGDADRLKRFGEGADLVELDEDRVGDAGRDAAAEDGGVGDEDVVADELDAVADALGELGPAGRARVCAQARSAMPVAMSQIDQAM